MFEGWNQYASTSLDIFQGSNILDGKGSKQRTDSQVDNDHDNGVPV